MAGLWILGLLLLIAAVPVVLVYLWFRFRRFPLPALWFLLSLLAGVFSVLIAAVLQGLLFRGTLDTAPQEGMGAFFASVFLRIALTEEAGRALALALLFRLARVCKGLPFPSRDQGSRAFGEEALRFGAAMGLVAGLGFALIENASYGASDMRIALLRTLTSAPLHGACAARIGMGVLGFRERPFRGLGRFLSAVILHGMYNLMVISPVIPPILPILIAFSALVTAMQCIRSR
ncbi:MAG: PrsW family intramembrane metalloprotease [Treponema sp.]|jgi:RsiW-degrading membrane proteinase PrsW (M82 family)|nr:PrsW family intramembrane metalloprotease [Treponema sp.]